MPNAVAILRNSPASNPDKILLKVTPSGAYTAGGDVLNLTPSTWTDPGGEGMIGPSFLPPIPPTLDVANAGGYRAEIIPGTTLANAMIKWYIAAGTELPAAAYPAAITGAYVMVTVFLRGA